LTRSLGFRLSRNEPRQVLRRSLSSWRLTCPALGLSSPRFGLLREASWRGWGVGALDGVGVRAGAQPYFGPRPWCAAGRRQDVRWGDPAGGSVAAAQSFEAVHANVSAAAVREPAAAHRCE
jgi:hypothetical protein